ncbi:MAG: hypothetical protein GY750_02605 [Lentisphaerae bacterium]|nr:hypothetical protein [Lentisphaerota bacterium]MCP4100313.1 hypothetical protein [Lentisphaerota bacterium]
MKKGSFLAGTAVLFLFIFSFSVQALEIVDRSPDGKGYKAALDKAHNKYLVHLQGNGRKMGYQHGWMLADDVKYICSYQFYRDTAMAFLGGDPKLVSVIKNDILFKPIIAALVADARRLSPYIPQEFADEMRGIRDGAKARLQSEGKDVGEISYDHLLVSNMAFDLVLSVAYRIIVKDLKVSAEEEKKIRNNVYQNMHMCDGFVINKAGTTTGGVMMGRSFMNLWSMCKNTVIMNYNPTYGHRIISPNIPGFTGIAVGMNDAGLSMGMDMVPAEETSVVFSGKGCLLLTRYLLSKHSNVRDAVDDMDHSARGVPWIYIMADAGTGAVAEAGANTWGGKFPWDHATFGARFIDWVDTNAPRKNGVQQIENDPRYIVASNHFIMPNIIIENRAKAIEDSTNRYNTLVRLVGDKVTGGGVSIEDGKQLVNYLCPLDYNIYKNTTMYNGNKCGDFYKSSQGKVDGIRALLDVPNRRVYAMYGNYSDPWAVFQL